MEARRQQQPINFGTAEEHKSKYIASINGPFLFTAPHSGKLKRGGAEYDEKRRIHLRERYTHIANQYKDPSTGKVAGQLGSFCFWSKDHKLNEVDLDPNYLYSGNMTESPFHQLLHEFQVRNAGKPLFHIDVHGKMDRKDNYDLDLGIACILKHWDEQYGESDFIVSFVNNLKVGFDKILKTIPTHKGFTAKCNQDPVLHGNWGGDLRTMNEQAIILGIPSIQLEIPYTMRALLAKDDKFAKAFVGVIINAYNQVIVNWWPAKQVPLLCDAELGSQVRLTNYRKQELETLHQQYVDYEKKVISTDKYI